MYRDDDDDDENYNDDDDNIWVKILKGYCCPGQVINKIRSAATATNNDDP